MLVLSRKVGESIMVGDNTEIRVLSINGTRTRIGVIAPRTVRVVRSELAELAALTQGTSSNGQSQPESAAAPGGTDAGPTT